VLENETVEVDAPEALEELELDVATDVEMDELLDEVLDEALLDVNVEVEKEPLEGLAAR